jgi:hypothetical protein
MSSQQEKASHKLLLVTYFRGGSTLLGELFYQNPHALYWFEPLEGVMNYAEGYRQEISSVNSSLEMWHDHQANKP